jgi:hypothetical protein
MARIRDGRTDYSASQCCAGVSAAVHRAGQVVPDGAANHATDNGRTAVVAITVTMVGVTAVRAVGDEIANALWLAYQFSAIARFYVDHTGVVSVGDRSAGCGPGAEKNPGEQSGKAFIAEYFAHVVLRVIARYARIIGFGV